MTLRMRRASARRGGQPSASGTACSPTRAVSSLRARIGHPGRIAEEPRAELQQERRGARLTPGHDREPAGSLSRRTITHTSERGPAVHSFRHAIHLGSAPPPAQGTLGDRYVEEAFAGVWNGVTKANIRILTIKSTRARHVTAMLAGRRSYREQPMGWGCGSPGGTPAKAALGQLAAGPGIRRPAVRGSGRHSGVVSAEVLVSVKGRWGPFKRRR